ncbi:DUF6712 family protein [Flavobacterium psychrotrophum]|uniref:DUF6712 family protein n=1 Tax=Flavobacterium psychrotrophum TaxID=2294119 RepID=UPI000E3241FC|nr:DUF6712 family protein [Flavobacterium psychrotrophum]
MKLLFAKPANNGSSPELKELLGFIDADIKFSKIQPDIITATKSLVRLIGQDMYDKITDAYTDGAEDLEMLVYHARYPIAVEAYALLANSNDVAHTTNGRKMRQDENEKQAFEWMLDRDNEALVKRYYRAMDDLLEYLEDVEGWKGSEAYKKVKKLFVNTTAIFDDHFTIQSRLILLQLAPGLLQCERKQILPRIGKERYEGLKTLVQSGGEIEGENFDLLEAIQEACVYHSLAWGMLRLSVTIFPEGVLQAYTSDRDSTQIRRPAANLEVPAARQAFLKDAADALERIEQLVAVPPPPAAAQSDSSIFPEFITGTNYIST